MPKQIETKYLQDRQKLVASIDIFDESIVASIHDNGTVKRGLIEVGSLIEMLGGIGAKEARWVKVEKNVAAMGMTSGGELRVLVVRPANWTTIACEIGRRKRKLKIKMPKLLGELSADRKPKGIRYTAVKAVYAFAGRLDDRTQLYAAPCPNMHSGGDLCMGNVDVKRFGHLPAAECFEKAFIESLFTDHHGEVLNEAARKKYRGVVDMIKKTKGNVKLSDLLKVKKYGQITKN